MIQVVGIRHDVQIEIRQRLSIIPKHVEKVLKNMESICQEGIIISTCNRTEIYFNIERDDISMVKDIFKCAAWDIKLMDYTFHHKGIDAIKHIMDVSCGFDSLIPGEDQILGQVKGAYDLAVKAGTLKNELQRLFQTAITCGKEFRTKSKLYKVPVSTASIVIREARKRGIGRFMILGFGEIGKLASKYILSGDYDILYIAVRDTSAVDIDDEKIRVVPFKERAKYYNDVDCIVSATSAPHVVICADELTDKSFLIFDMAVPRDVDEDVYKLKNVEVYDIDRLSSLNDENYNERRAIMDKYRFIVDNYIEDYVEWQNLREIAPTIYSLKCCGEKIYKRRLKTFRNKKESKDGEMLAEMLLKSTSNAFVNRAIEVLKDEYLKGRGEECKRIIEKIFLAQ